METEKSHRTFKVKIIELLIISAILGVLAAVVVPNVGRFIARGEPQLEAPALCIVYVWEQGQKKEVDRITIGEALIWYPKAMRIGDSEEILFRLIPSQELTTATTDITYPRGLPNIYSKVSDITYLYPIMLAELKAINFEVSVQTSDYRQVSLETKTDWTWSITPKAIGEQLLIVELSAPAEVQGFEQMVTQAIFSRSFNISVTESFDWASLWQSPIWQAIVAILGILGWIIVFFERRRRRQSRQEPKKEADSSISDV